MNVMPPRLTNHPLFRTSDLDEAREAVARVFCPHHLDFDEGARQLTAVHNSARLRKVSVNYLDYGAPVHIEPGELDSIFVVQVPVAGRSVVSCGTQRIVSTPELASVPTPTEHLDMHWASGDPKLIVKVDRQVLEDVMERLVERALTEPVRFTLGMDLTSPAGRSWLELAWLMVTEVERGDGLVRQPTAVAHLEDALLTSLLLSQPSNYSERLHEPSPAAPPKAIRLAVELMESRATQALTTAQIARAVGVSVRSLQEGFSRHVGCSPMAHLRDIRLRRVREELGRAAPGHCTVREVAYDWGFFHLGRFSAAYRAKFGESPSETLRNA